MNTYMNVKEYCRKTGFSEKLLRKLCKGEQADKFCRKGNSKQSHVIITVEEFERLWQEGKL